MQPQPAVPFLSDMSRLGDARVHADADGTYCVALWPGAALVAAWSCEAMGTGPDNPSVLQELRRLRDMANNNAVPPAHILLVDCSSQTTLTHQPIHIIGLVHDALKCGMGFDSIRGNFLWPFTHNARGLDLTQALLTM